MNINFSTNKLQRELSDERAMTRAYGERARKLRLRLDLLKNAVTLSDISHQPPPRRHELTGDWAGHFAVDIQQNWRLIFYPNHSPVPLLQDGGMDLSKITAITIVAIVDYHGQ